MCEAKVYLERSGQRELVMEDAATIRPVSGGVELVGLFGEKRVVKGRLDRIELVEHSVTVKAD